MHTNIPTENPRILWIDDDSKGIKNWIPNLEKYDLKFETASNGREGIKKLSSSKSNFDKVLVDLDMPEMNGVDVIRYLEKSNPDLPVAILSAHYDEPLWKNKLKRLKTKIPVIDSPLPIEGSEKFMISLKEILKGLVFDSSKCPPFYDYMDLSFNDSRKIKQDIYDINKRWIEKQFLKLNAEWILVQNDKVVQYSNCNDDFPNTEDLINIGSRTNVVPFLFFRTPLVEEINWNFTVKRDDYFPTIKLSIVKDKSEKSFIADFDTGSVSTILDFDELESKGIVQESPLDIFHTAYHLGREYKFIKKKASIRFTTSCKSIETIVIPCVFVKKWSTSPFKIANHNRKALVGRDILQKASFFVELHPKDKVTRLKVIKQKS